MRKCGCCGSGVDTPASSPNATMEELAKGLREIVNEERRLFGSDDDDAISTAFAWCGDKARTLLQKVEQSR